MQQQHLPKWEALQAGILYRSINCTVKPMAEMKAQDSGASQEPAVEGTFFFSMFQFVSGACNQEHIVACDPLSLASFPH